KLLDFRARIAPGAGRETRFYARLVEKRVAIPPVIGGDLREEEAGVASARNDESVAADRDLFDVRHALDRSHDGDLELDVVRLARLRRIGARLAEGRGEAGRGDRG